MAEALEGMTVLEWCEGTAGAYCGKLLADLGAKVIKVEPPGGDPARRAGPFGPQGPSPEASGRYLYCNTGKSSVVLDLSVPADAAVFGELVRSADVVLSDRTEAAATELLVRMSRAVWCSITPFGLTGPYRHYRAEHLNIAHAGGEGHVLPGGVGWTMFPDRPPAQIGSDMCDFDTGANAAIAVLAAYHRWRTRGAGQTIDVSGFETQVGLFRTRLVRYTRDGTVLHQRPSPYTSVGGMFTCTDGYVQILGPREDSWLAVRDVEGGDVFADDRFLTLADRTTFVTELNEILAGWCASRSKQEIVKALGPIGFAVGAYAVPSDLLASDQLATRGFFETVEHPVAGPVVLPGLPFSLSATPVSLRPAPLLGSGVPAFTPADRAGAVGSSGSAGPVERGAPLAGIRVLDFTWAIAGPYATMLLAFLGAEVIRIESAKRPDVSRRGFSGRDYGGINLSPDYHTLNANKRSLRIDLTQPAGLAVVRRLLATGDVVVDNFRPGVMERFGFGHDTLLAEHPGLIVASSSGNGSKGPEALYAGLASIFAAVGGVSEQTGYPDAPPTLIGESPDFRSGNLLAVALLAALAHRDRTGAGQFIDLSSTEVMTALTPDALLAHSLGAAPVTRRGNRHPRMAPHNVYPCAEEHGWISVAVADESAWAGLCGLLGRSEWTQTYPDPAARRAAEDIIDEAVARFTGTLRAREAFDALQAAGVPAAPSFSNQDLLEDPHLAARGVFVDVEHPELGVQRLPGPPWLLSDHDWHHAAAAPDLGQDNDYVLSELLGLTADEVAALGDIFI